jgi:urease accessory protein UreF
MPRRYLLLLALSGVFWWPPSAALAQSNPLHSDSVPSEPLFSRHVVPLLSRLGCNSGACHGAVQGKGGLRLSLFGYQPGLDYERLMREFGGRRVNRTNPDTSLFLLKATSQVPHEGGMRTMLGSYEYQVLRNWVAAGSRLDAMEKSRVQQMFVTPAHSTVRPGDRLALQVQAVFSDGSREDVTKLCVFESVNRDVAEVDHRGRVEVRSIGDTAIVVRYPGQVVVATVVATPAVPAREFPKVQEHNFIDKHILARLRLLNIQPSELCDDATFLRRVKLDVTGTLPTPDEVRAFLADKSPDKRSKIIDALLDHPDHAALWATRFMDIFRLSGFTAGGIFGPDVHDEFRAYEWLRARLLENIGYDELVERILTATTREGRSLEEWAKSAQAIAREQAEGKMPTTYASRKTLDLFWQRRMETDVDHAIRVGHAFLGLRLQCAQCHRHPNDVWTQDDLLSFANFFMRIPHFNGSAQPRAKASDEVLALQKKLGKEMPRNAVAVFNKYFGDREIWVLTEKDLNGPGMKNGRTFFNSGQKATGFAIVTSPLGTQTSHQLRFLGDRQAVPPPPDGVDRRQLVMGWLRRPDNPFFAKAIVNRIWAHYFQRGIVDPPDDLSPLNPPSHPELLQELCDNFIKNKYDLKWLHRTILNSRTYQQSSQTNDSNRHDRRNFASFYLRRLPAEVLLDCFQQAAGVSPGAVKDRAELGMPPGLRLIEGGALFYRKNSDTGFALDVFGRPQRNVEVQCDCERENDPNILQALVFANHPWARRAVESPTNRITELLKKPASDTERITELFLATVSRPPTDREIELCVNFLRSSSSSRQGYEGLLWSLLNSNEFIFNH